MISEGFKQLNIIKNIVKGLSPKISKKEKDILFKNIEDLDKILFVCAKNASIKTTRHYRRKNDEIS